MLGILSSLIVAAPRALPPKVNTLKTRALHSHPKSETQTRREAVYDHSQMCELPL